MTSQHLGISFKETKRGLKDSPKWYYWGKEKHECGSCGHPIYLRTYKQQPRYKGQRVHHRGWSND